MNGFKTNKISNIFEIKCKLKENIFKDTLIKQKRINYIHSKFIYNITYKLLNLQRKYQSMEQNIKMLRVIVHVKKIWLNVRFNCKLSFLLKNQYNETVAQSQNSYELIKGQCHVNQAIYFESNVNFGHLKHKKMKLIIMMISANGMVPAGSVTFTIYNKSLGEKAQQIYSLQKCDDLSAKVKFVHLYQNSEQVNIGNSYISQYKKSVLLQKQNSSETKGNVGSSIYKLKSSTSPLGRQNSSNYKIKKSTIITPLMASRYGQRQKLQQNFQQQDIILPNSNRSSNLSPRYNLSYGRSIISSKQKSKDRLHYYENNAKNNMKASKILVEQGEQFQASRTQQQYHQDNKNQEYFRRIVILQQQNDQFKQTLLQTSQKLTEINLQCEQYMQTIRQMDKELNCYKQKFNETCTLSTTLSKRLQEKDHELQQEQIMKKQLNDKNSELLRIITEKDQNIGFLTLQNQKIAQDLQLRSVKILFLEQKIQSYKKSINQSQQQSQKLDVDLKSLEEEFNNKHTQIQDLKSRLKDRQENIGKLLVTRNELHLQISQLTQKISQLQYSDSQKFKAIQKLNDDIIEQKNTSTNWLKQFEKLKLQLESKDSLIFQNQQRNDLLQRDLLKAKDQVKQYKRILHNLNEQLSKANQKLNKQAQDFANQSSNKIEQIKILNKTAQNLRSQISQLKQDVQSLQEQIQRHKKLNIMMTNKLKSYQAQKSNLSIKISQQQKRLKKKQSELEQLSLQKQNSLQKLQQELAKQQQNFSKLKQQLAFVKELLNKSNLQNQKQNASFESLRKNFQNQIHRLKSENQIISQKLTQKEKQFSKLLNEKEELVKKQLYNRKFQTKYQEILQESVIKDEEIKKISQEKKSILQTRHKLEEKLTAQNNQISSLSVQITKLESTIETLNQNSKNSKLSHSQQIKELNNILKSQANLHGQAKRNLQKKLQEKQNLIETMSKTQKSLKGQIDFLTEMIQKIKAQNIESQQKIKSQTSTLQIQSKITLQIKQKELQFLAVQKQRLLDEKNTIIESLNASLAQLKNKLSQQEEKNVQLQIMIDLNEHNQKQRQKLKQKFKQLVAENLLLKNQLNSSKKQIDSMRKIEFTSETSLKEQIQGRIKQKKVTNEKVQKQQIESKNHQKQRERLKNQASEQDTQTLQTGQGQGQQKSKNKKKKKIKNK